MAAPRIRLPRGGGTIPPGYVLGRTDGGAGDVQLLAISALTQGQAAGAGAIVGAQSLSLYALGNTTNSSSGVNAPGALSFSGAGIATVGVTGSVVQISVTAPASAATMALTAIGNTTGSSSATTRSLTAETLSGAGIVSIGFSGNSIIISASTAATNPLLSLYAVGNTTTSVSSGVIAAGSLSFDGAGAVSVGISGSSVVISAPATVASGTVQSVFALGNTTAATSSTTLTLTNWSLSGAGGVSIGYSTTGAGAGVVVISGATSATSMGMSAVGNTAGTTSSMSRALTTEIFSGAGAVSVGYSGGSIVISGATGTAIGVNTISYLEPRPIGATVATQGSVLGSMMLMPVLIPAALSIDQVRLIDSRTFVAASLAVGSAAAVSGTATASAAWSLTERMVRYTEPSVGSFASADSGSVLQAITWSYSVSRTGASNSASLTVTFQYASGSGTTTSTMSNSGNSVAVATYSNNINPGGTSAFIGLMLDQIPWATSFAAGFNVFGHLLESTAVATETGATWLTVTAGSWSKSHLTQQGMGASTVRSSPGASGSPVFLPLPHGAGMISTAGSTQPATFTSTAVSTVGAAGYNLRWMEFGVFG